MEREKKSNIHLLGFPKGEKKENEIEAIFKEIMAKKKFLNQWEMLIHRFGKSNKSQAKQGIRNPLLNPSQ